MRRRTLVFALGLCPLAPLAALAQVSGRVPRIGFLGVSSRTAKLGQVDAFKAGMREHGRSEGRDYELVYRFAEGDMARLPVLAAELVSLKVDLIFAPNTVVALAARKATRDIPIVIAIAADPVGVGLAASLSRPGGNVTGLTALGSELIPKRLELMREILPALACAGYLYNPDSAIDRLMIEQFQEAAKRLGIKSVPAVVRTEGDIEAAFQKLDREGAGAAVASATIVNVSLRERLVERAARKRLPVMYGSGEFVESGGLISYSANYPDQYRRAAGYVDKILKGAKPGDLPIEQPTKFELVVNMKTAKALGVKIPQSVLLRADRVIE